MFLFLFFFSSAFLFLFSLFALNNTEIKECFVISLFHFFIFLIFCVVTKRIEQQKRTKAIRYILLSWKCVFTVASCNVLNWKNPLNVMRINLKLLCINRKEIINTVIMCTFYSPMFHSSSPPSSSPKVIATKHTHFLWIILQHHLMFFLLLYPPTVYLLFFSRSFSKSSFNFIITH